MAGSVFDRSATDSAVFLRGAALKYRAFLELQCTSDVLIAQDVAELDVQLQVQVAAAGVCSCLMQHYLHCSEHQL